MGYWRRETVLAADLTGFDDDEPMVSFWYITEAVKSMLYGCSWNEF